MKRSSAENSKLFASPVALSKVEKGRKSTFFLQNNLLLFLLKIAVVGVHIAAVNLAERPAERKKQEQAPHLNCLFLYKKWWHIASPPSGNQRNIFVCFIWRQSQEATGEGWTEVLFGRSALEDWKTGRLAQSTIWKRGAGGQTDKRPFRSSSLRLLRSIDILNCQQKGARRNSSEELSNLKQRFRNQDQNK